MPDNCMHCHEYRHAGYKHCPHCGAELDQPKYTCAVCGKHFEAGTGVDSGNCHMCSPECAMTMLMMGIKCVLGNLSPGGRTYTEEIEKGEVDDG